MEGGAMSKTHQKLLAALFVVVILLAGCSPVSEALPEVVAAPSEIVTESPLCQKEQLPDEISHAIHNASPVAADHGDYWRVIDSDDNFRIVQIYESPSWYLRYEIISNSGEVVFSHVTSGNAWIENVEPSILEFRHSAGTFVWWGLFYHLDDDTLSEVFNGHFHLKGSTIAYLNRVDDDQWQVIVRDAFDVDRFYVEFSLIIMNCARIGLVAI